MATKKTSILLAFYGCGIVADQVNLGQDKDRLTYDLSLRALNHRFSIILVSRTSYPPARVGLMSDVTADEHKM